MSISHKRVPAPRRFNAVEGRAVGVAPLDGNSTNKTVSSMFSQPNWTDEAVPLMLDQLMEYTKGGHLAWVVFPPQGYRL